MSESPGRISMSDKLQFVDRRNQHLKLVAGRTLRMLIDKLKFIEHEIANFRLRVAVQLGKIRHSRQAFRISSGDLMSTGFSRTVNSQPLPRLAPDALPQERGPVTRRIDSVEMLRGIVM